jgi:peptidoglycan/xylan/chitin deacetylase (PgdA/CDA1 family)
MVRWNLKRPLRAMKRSVSAFLICLIVALPLFFTVFQWSRIVRGDTSRQATPLPVFVQRPVDKGSTPQLFSRPLITITFDDGWESVYTVAMPLLQKYGIHSTQYVLSGTESFPAYMSWEQISMIQKNGHEIACHSVNHPDLTTIDNNSLEWQLQTCQTNLSKRYGSVTDFASPYGSYNAHTIDAIQKVYQSQRNINGVIADGISDADVNLPSNFDRYNIIGVTVRRETTVAELQQLVAYTEAHNGWLVLTYHQADDGPSQYGIDPQAMEKQLAYLSSTKLPIVTVAQAIRGTAQGPQR